MQNHIDKTQTGKSGPVAAGKTVQGKAALNLKDNRPQSVAQQKIIEEEEPAVKESIPEPIQKKENDTGLPDDLKSGIENLSGHSMDDVKVHYNSAQPAQLNAHAYAQGTNIHIAPGQEKHLPHEAWHVVQQKQGRVKPTTRLKQRVSINDDRTLENEAGTMGAKALYTPQSFVPAISTFVPAAGTIQHRSIAQLAKRTKQTVSGHGDLRRNNKKQRVTFKVPKGKSVMRAAPPGATLGDLSMLLNTMKNPKREDIIKKMKVSTTAELWKNKKILGIIRSNKDIPKTKVQEEILEDLELGNVEYKDLKPSHKGSLTKLESKKEFEEWTNSHVSQHSFQTFGEDEELDDMVLTPFESKLRSTKKNDQNEYVEKKTNLSDYMNKTNAKEFMVNSCSYDPNAEFTGFQIDQK